MFSRCSVQIVPFVKVFLICLWKEIAQVLLLSHLGFLLIMHVTCAEMSAVSSERFSFNVAYILKITAIRKCQLLLTRTKITICIFIAFPFPKAIKEIPLCFFPGH